MSDEIMYMHTIQDCLLEQLDFTKLEAGLIHK